MSRAPAEKLSLNGTLTAHRQARDSVGHALPRWEGCHRLSGDDDLLLGETENSFDGLYWGVVGRSVIEGRWRLLIVTATHGA
jgi:type IV secretory pathway protease TraF